MRFAEAALADLKFYSRTMRARLATAALIAFAPIAYAQDKPVETAPAAGLGEKQMELRGVEDTLKASEEQRRKIESDLIANQAERARLAASLVETTSRVRAAEQRSAAIEKRLELTTGSEEAIRRSLESRRGVLAEVLASLQRMNRRPPPAILVKPEDMLQAVRAAMLMGAVLPELRAETEALAADLGEMARLRKAIAADKDVLAQEAASLKQEGEKLAGLIDQRSAAHALAEKALGAERERARELARQAGSLKDLIARMEGEVSEAGRAAEAARRSDEALRKARESDAQGVRARLALAPFKDPARLAPAVSFAETRGLLALPAAGAITKAFGASDGFGGAEKGLSLATRPNAVVSAPADGWVAYSGPYRTYGQLLILNVGGGYYVVLAGMERINVEVGQFVLAGEPVGAMGDGAAKTAAAIAIGASQPILYVEFRKDGVSIDPGPWWAKPENQKVRG